MNTNFVTSATNWGAGNIGNVGSFGNFGNFGNFGQPPSILNNNNNNNSTTPATANTTNNNNNSNNGNISSNINNQSDNNVNNITGHSSSNTNTSNSTTAAKTKNQPQPSMNIRLGNANPTANTPKLANAKISANNVAASGATSAVNSPAASVAQMIAPPGLQRTMSKTPITNEDTAVAAAPGAPGLSFQQLQRQHAQKQAQQQQQQQQQIGQQLQELQQLQVQLQQQIYGGSQLHQQVQIPNLTPAQQQQQFLLGQTQGNGNASSAAAAAAAAAASGSIATNGKATETDESNFTDIDRFGLKGLATMLGMPNTEQTKIAMGSDLLMTGYNLDSNDKLLPTFQSPWVETSIKDVEPAYKLPSSVKHLNKEKFKFLRPAENRISDYPEDTLFFIFYSKPKDILQELAARELRERNWRFHKVLKVWLAKVKEVEPIQETALSERGVYTFFDPQTWQRVTKEFILEYSAIL